MGVFDWPSESATFVQRLPYVTLGSRCTNVAGSLGAGGGGAFVLPILSRKHFFYTFSIAKAGLCPWNREARNAYSNTPSAQSRSAVSYSGLELWVLLRQRTKLERINA